MPPCSGDKFCINAHRDRRARDIGSHFGTLVRLRSDTVRQTDRASGRHSARPG
jgi:hypothetical protein